MLIKRVVGRLIKRIGRRAFLPLLAAILAGGALVGRAYLPAPSVPAPVATPSPMTGGALFEGSNGRIFVVSCDDAAEAHGALEEKGQRVVDGFMSVFGTGWCMIWTTGRTS